MTAAVPFHRPKTMRTNAAAMPNTDRMARASLCPPLPRMVSSMPFGRALGRVSARNPERARDRTQEAIISHAARGAASVPISAENAKYSSRYPAQASAAKAPMCGSFKIASFLSRSCREDRASAVSMKPSMCIPPVKATGASVKTAAHTIAPKPAFCASHRTRKLSAPVTAPTTGKKASA